MDRIFGREQNDLVVPTLRLRPQRLGRFPIEEPLLLADAGIHHNGFFGQQRGPRPAPGVAADLMAGRGGHRGPPR